MKIYFPFVLLFVGILLLGGSRNTVNAQEVTCFTTWLTHNTSQIKTGILDSSEVAARRSLEFGLGIAKHFRGGLMLQYGIGLAGRGSYLSKEGDPESRIRMSYLMVPLAFQKTLLGFSSFSIDYTLGLVPALRMGSSSLNNGVEEVEDFRRWDMGFRTGIGVRTFLDGRYAIGLDFLFEQGLWKVSTAENRFESDKRNSTVGVRLTFELPVKYSIDQRRVMY